MAWRIDAQVVRGEIDSRQRDRTTGRVWLAGREAPLELELSGSPWADLAGHLLRFCNPDPQPGDLNDLATEQRGAVGDMTASRKVRVPDCSIDEMSAAAEAGRPYPWHWANCLYLEWFSDANGRIVIECTSYELEIDASAGAAWTMSPEEELAQPARNAEALTGFVDRLCARYAATGDATGDSDGDGDGDESDFDDDLPQSAAEAEADANAAWMDRLLDRIQARIEREGFDADRYEQVCEEERARLRKESGYPPETDTKTETSPETEQEMQERIDAMDAAAAEALAELEAEKWKGRVEPARPELVERSMSLGVKLFRETAGWIPEDAMREHPLVEIVNGVQLASAKISGALGLEADRPWPPEALFAGDTLVRLKKSRDALRDTLRALDSADDESLATPEWRIGTRRAVADILAEVQQLIAEVRQVLRDAG